MRVLLIAHNCQSPAEGQDKVRCLLSMPDVELRVLVPDRWNNYGEWRTPTVPADLVDVIRVGRVRLPWAGPGQYYLHWYPDLEQIVREFRPDVINVWEEPWGLVSAQACRVRDRLVPDAKIVSETEQNVNKRLPPPFEWIRRNVLRRVDFMVARSDEAVRVVRGKGYAGPTEVVPNAVNTDLFRPMDRGGCRAGEQLGSGFVIGYVGRLVPQKGLADLVEAVSRCPVDVSVVMVGSGPIGGELRSQADALGLADRVRLLPSRPLEQLPAFMNAVDVLALPSRTTGRWKEQFGRVLIEAGACGTPVIGSDSGAIPDVVGDGGLVVPEQDPAALAAAILTLRNDPERRAALGRAGLAAARERFTWQRVSEQMRDIYRRVLSNSLNAAAVPAGSA